MSFISSIMFIFESLLDVELIFFSSPPALSLLVLSNHAFDAKS
jgi:hypothetical protein